MKKLLILMLLGVLFVPMNGSAKADEVLYCQSELATGLVQREDGTWKESSFVRTRYTIKFSSDYKRLKGLESDYYCFSDTRLNNRHICRRDLTDTGNIFIYHSQSKRFIYSIINIFSYLDGDTPMIKAGTCKKF